MPPLFGDTSSVLIVDDDATTLTLLESILETEGYECTRAHSASEARDRMGEHDFAVALVDIVMPATPGSNWSIRRSTGTRSWPWSW